MPAYKMGGLLMAYLKDDKMPEGIKEVDNIFLAADETPHPFHSAGFRKIVRAFCGVITDKPPTPERRTEDNVIYDSRMTELPIEERKRREAQEKGKAYRVPEWWRGEQANYQIAKKMMVTLPKRGKAPVRDT